MNFLGGYCICFGRAMGMMHGRIMDVHGAGAQRSDPKTGKDSIGRGPQGNARHGQNFVCLVRGGKATLGKAPQEKNPSAYPNAIRVDKGFEAAMPAGPPAIRRQHPKVLMREFEHKFDRIGDVYIPGVCFSYSSGTGQLLVV
ncbi:hypothetical protein [Desulfobacter vibrioformis]|uniref:hypothetical protein n=1 Tax=Desulfobacter vibrioformis TaxID=34031 RepID=UPI0005557665|nr:hypothetical protein [Desulfobacter vibrioformis]